MPNVGGCGEWRAKIACYAELVAAQDLSLPWQARRAMICGSCTLIPPLQMRHG